MERFFKRPWLIVTVILLITVFFAFQLPRIELDNNNYRFIPKSDQARIDSEFIDETFGSQIIVLVGLERKYGTVLDADFLNRLKSYSEAIKTIDKVDRVQSLISTDYITSDGDSIVVEPMVGDGFTGTDEEIATVKSRVLSWNMYERALVSDDLRATQVMVSLDVTSEEAGAPAALSAYRDVKRIAQETFDSTDTTVYVTGIPVLSGEINAAVKKDMILLIPLVILVVLFVLFFSFKRGFAVIIPLLTVIVATIWSVGAMPIFGVKMSVLSTVLPVILVAVGSAYGIHVVTHYIDERELKPNLTKEEHRNLVFALVRKIGKPVLLAALTTFVGFISFSFTQVIPIREFGFFSSFGVIVSFIVAITFIPALFLIRGPVPLKRKLFEKRRNPKMNGVAGDPLSIAIADAFMSVAHKKRTVLVLTVLMVAVGLFGLSKLVVDNVMVEYFKDNADIAISDRFIRRQFGGSKLVSLVVQSKEKGGVLDPDVLLAMDGLADYLSKEVPEVGKVTSFTDLVKRINQVYNADESPDGIRPVTQTSPSDGFGFSAFSDTDSDSDSGFGDFGSFDSVSADESTPTAVASSLEASDTATAKPGLTKDEMVAALNNAIQDGSSYSLDANALVSELRRAVNYEGAAYYEIPSDPEKYGKKTKAELKDIISNYMMLLSGDISSFANDPLEPSAIRMNIQLRTTGQIDTDRAITAINDYVKAKFPDTVTVMVGGTALIERSLNLLVVGSQLSSVFISLLMVFLIILVSYRSVVAGIIGIVPLSISILLNFAIMGFAGIKLNIATALVASVSVGIGVDYTIHYLESYYHEWRKTGGKGDYLRETFRTSGKAIMINAVSVGAGFAVLILSQFNILAEFGFLIAFTMFSSSIIALTVPPVLLGWLKPSFLARNLATKNIAIDTAK